jgi:RNA polymerase sigma-70 factor (ECF subfamily)
VSASNFAATRWTLVVQARGSDTAAQAALSELCAAYYEPVVAFLRAAGRTEDVARELTHDFFARVLGGDSLAGADAARGRFRSYLLGAVKHFAADQKDRAFAEKRGGGQEAVPLDHASSNTTGAGVQIAAPTVAEQEHNFDRHWALTVIARALNIVEAELREAGKGAHFDTLKPWLSGSADSASESTQADAAQSLGISDGAVKVAIHRLRRRFREAVRVEIAQTVPADADVDDELRHLLAVLIAR